MFLSKFFTKKKQKKAKLAVIGPSRSGKTTFIRFLETGEPVLDELHTTLGIEIREQSKPIGNWQFTTIDTGGQKIYQQVFWELAVQESSLVIFVVDATIRPETDLEKFNAAKLQFEYAAEIISDDQPLLILLNKQDLQDLHPLSARELIDLFEIKMASNSIGLIETSVKFGTGVDEAINWMIQVLGDN